MYAVIDGFEKMNELKDSGEKNEEGEPIMVPVYPDAKLNISAPDDRTFVVTLSYFVSYWNELLAFPTF